MRTRGFTLLEVLIALAILAVALAAITRASGGAVDATQVLKERTLALWVAQNQLAKEISEDAWPDAGAKDGEAEEAGIKFVWRETVSETPEPRFRRVVIEVFSPTRQGYVAAQLSGYLSNPKAGPST
jgi:general secretion pathway protein I